MMSNEPSYGTQKSQEWQDDHQIKQQNDRVNQARPMRTTDSNSDVEKQLDPYLKLIEIFNSVHLRAKPREDILAWHHEQVKQARIDELENVWYDEKEKLLFCTSNGTAHTLQDRLTHLRSLASSGGSNNE